MELRERIRLTGFTLSDFAQHVGICRQSLVNYMNGRRALPPAIDEQLNLLIRNRTPAIRTELERIDQITLAADSQGGAKGKINQ